MQSRDVNLYLVGFMGTGKTTIGRAVAHRMGFALLDSDHEIERKQGKTIPQIFASDEKGVVICLHASLDTILRRTQGNKNRPLLDVEDPMERIRTLYAVREPIYNKAGTVILTDGRPMLDIVQHVMRAYRREAAEFARAAAAKAKHGR
ncbi:MAG: shikimate kinase [Rariglobus sp.]|nr:shikimate kinase [Rariglobus sp.]